MKSSIDCGKISLDLFVCNITSFSEFRKFNSCLNCKISIDSNGEIKNCPSFKESFGNISSSSLVEVLNDTNFQKLWHISKDKISVCKECEYRYICVDCRAFLEEPDNICSKPLKCGYNPSTGKWSDWRKHKHKQRAIKF